jgi:hypothetical protein
MKQLVASLMVVAAAAFILGSGIQAQEKKKEVTLKGKITCAKCDLKVEGVTKCATVIVFKGKKGNEVVAYFDKDAHKKYHGDICTTPKQGSVTGTISRDRETKKVTIKVKSVNFD